MTILVTGGAGFIGSNFKTTDYYAPEFERSIIWNDTDISIAWPIHAGPILSAKDLQAKTLATTEHFA